ncbi:hypothetical protein IEQ34_004396 [Dendrobium chrysotoxum]|uniref:Pentatricopeptide repeat-containing protein n=1 Tax=Dendrobium chrysotoxum TaxID=161865 RepID=A0AAV7HGI2_DENCH|nr:hypothetical protein IEQ34_004396 [Dendrobium chrysotoxum]
MKELLLVENDFTRTLPLGLGYYRNLNSVWIYNNRISGYVPIEMWKQPHIRILKLNNGYVTSIGATYLSMLLTNQFTRSIPRVNGLLYKLYESTEVVILKFLRALHGFQHCATSSARTGVELFVIAGLVGVYKDPAEKAHSLSIFKASANADRNNVEYAMDFCYSNMKNVSEAVDWRKNNYSKLFIEQQTQQSPAAENKVFDETPKRNDISFTSKIYGYAQNCQPNETFKLFVEMYNRKIKPDQVVIVEMMSAWAQLDMNVNCGNMERAAILFDLQIRNLFSYCSLMPGYSILGSGAKAAELFDKMLKEEIIPYDVAFTRLTPCRQASLIEEGSKNFKLMKDVYSIDPFPDYYACMVDLLGQAGLIKAYEFVKSMSMESHAGVWGVC